MTVVTAYELEEYRPLHLPRHALSDSVAQALWKDHAGKISIEPPSFKTDQQWVLNNQGWVGHIPLPGDLQLNLLPKVPLKNLFGMYEVAYKLKSFYFLDGMSSADALREFYEQLAHALSKRVLDRARRGYHRAYVAEQDQLSYVRGRLDMGQLSRAPTQIRLHCQYEEHTADIEDNQILAWTLRTILRSGLCRASVQPTVAHAYRSLQGFASLQPFAPRDCANRLYNRLNLDYHPLHALCRFFLDQAGPGHTSGAREMIPFVVDMARLFELFVAEWLQTHLPYPWKAMRQHKVTIGTSDSLSWNVDILIQNQRTTESRWILDTKYKRDQKPSPDDVAQVVAYAQAKGSHEAVLVYPTPLQQPLDEMVGDIRVRSLTFDLMGDLDDAGAGFLAELGVGMDDDNNILVRTPAHQVSKKALRT